MAGVLIGPGIELIAFDLDGTLVDSAPDLCYCLGIALEAIGLRAPSEPQTRGWIGGGIEQLVRRALAHSVGNAVDSDTFAETLRAFSACYARNLFARSRLYADVADTLDVLRGRGMRLCCVTNKRLAFADGLLAEAGIRDRFELVFGGDSLSEKKPSGMQLEAAAHACAVSSAACAMVGDSDLDWRAARAAGFGFVWATYGYSAAPPVDLPEEAPRIARFAELAQLLGPATS